jgi:hypothetical protein
VTGVPTLVLRGAARGLVRYLGIPAGLEFGTLPEDLSAVSRGTTTLKQESRTELASLTKPVHVQVFVTPTCPYCPKVASLLARHYPRARVAGLADAAGALRGPGRAAWHRRTVRDGRQCAPHGHCSSEHGTLIAYRSARM